MAGMIWASAILVIAWVNNNVLLCSTTSVTMIFNGDGFMSVSLVDPFLFLFFNSRCWAPFI